MIDIKLTLIQLQTFVAVAEHGSFSAAARALDKAQSAVSHAIGQMEQELQLELFDRSARTPQLTEAGHSLLDKAREVLFNGAQFQQLAEQWTSASREQSFSLVIDMIYPVEPLVQIIGSLKERFPGLTLTVHTEARGAVTARLLDQTGHLGITGLLLPKVPTGIEAIPLSHVSLVAVAAPEHPLAELGKNTPLSELRKYTQLVLDDRSQLSTDHQVGVVGANHWKIGSQVAKHRFLQAGFGWGVMPWHQVRDDLEEGRLCRIRPGHWSGPKIKLPLHIIHRGDRPLGRVDKEAITLFQETLSWELTESD